MMPSCCWRRKGKVHDFFQLAVFAGIYNDLLIESQDVEFNAHWSAIREWSEDARYSTGKENANVKTFLISVKTVSKWIEKHLSAT